MKTLTSFDGVELSLDTIQFLFNQDSLIDYIEKEQQKYPFPGGYTPREINIYFDGKRVGSISGSQEAKNIITPTTPPRLIEWKFDDETAVLLCGQDILINRTSQMVNFDLSQANSFLGNK